MTEDTKLWAENVKLRAEFKQSASIQQRMALRILDQSAELREARAEIKRLRAEIDRLRANQGALIESIQDLVSLLELNPDAQNVLSDVWTAINVAKNVVDVALKNTTAADPRAKPVDLLPERVGDTEEASGGGATYYVQACVPRPAGDLGIVAWFADRKGGVTFDLRQAGIFREHELPQFGTFPAWRTDVVNALPVTSTHQLMLRDLPGGCDDRD